jgi:lipopolysaccharide/colanic/teichoic acid biosynthesis glycosyltransferase
MMVLDCQYVRKATLWLDLRILLLTVPALVLGLLRALPGRGSELKEL